MGAGGQDTITVTINYTEGTTWPLPYSIDWSQAAKVEDKVQIVEGEWDLEADSMFHYQEKVCLLQMAGNGENVVIDPLEVIQEKRFSTSYCFGINLPCPVSPQKFNLFFN